MWAQPRPLQHVSFAQRIAFPGLPVVWCVLCVQQSTGGFMTNELAVCMVIAYILVAVWYGTLRELTARADENTLKSLQTMYAVRTWMVRLSNTVADAGAAMCFLFFLLNWFPAAWFLPLLFGTTVAHLGTEFEVEQRLRALHAHRGYWGGRRPTDQELRVLEALDAVQDVEVSIVPAKT